MGVEEDVGAGFEGGEAGRTGERRAEGGGAEQADRLGGREQVGARRKWGRTFNALSLASICSRTTR